VATVTLNPAVDFTLTVRDFRAGAVNRVEPGGQRAGGKGVNVAAALARAGYRVAAHGFLGRDNAALFEEFFAREGVEDRAVRLPGATRTGFKLVDTVRGETTDLNFPGLAPDTAALEALVATLDTTEAAWCVLAGSLPPGVPKDFYGQAVRRLRARGVKVALDASGPALRHGVEAAPDVAKPNVHELAGLVRSDLTDTEALVAAARTFTAAGVRLVAVSRGSEGACFVTAGAVVRARGPVLREGSTVGAGDAMVAGIVAAELAGLGLADCARQATAYSLRALAGSGTIAEWAARVKIAG